MKRNKGVALVIDEIAMVMFVVAPVAILAAYAGLLHLLPATTIPPAFSVSRKNENTIHVVLRQKVGVDVVEKLLNRD